MCIYFYVLNIVVALVLLILTYFACKLSFWQRRGVYCKFPSILFGNTTEIWLGRRCMGEDLKEAYDDLKKKRLRFGGYYAFVHPILVIADLDLITSILVKDFGHFTDHANFANPQVEPLNGHLFNLTGRAWKETRTKLTPAFSSGKLKMMFQVLLHYSQDLKQMLDEMVQRNDTIKMKTVSSRFTSDVIMSTAFGLEANCMNDPNSTYHTYGTNVFDINWKQFLRKFFFIMWPEVLYFFRISPMPSSSTRFIRNVIESTVHYREENDIVRKDFLHLLIQLKNNVNLNADGPGILKKPSKGGQSHEKDSMTMNELCAQAYLIWTAGFESSATTITFCMYELAKNEDLQQEAREEITKVLKRFNNKLTYDALQEMNYLERCIFETLRKYPPIPIHTRKCTKPYKVPNSSLTLRKGQTVFIPVLGIQHDPHIYPDPEKFDPDRFLVGNVAKRHSSAWTPFGNGPRICSGLRFGVVQIKMALSVMLSNYRFRVNEDTMNNTFSFNPKCWMLSANDEIWLNCEKITTL